MSAHRVVPVEPTPEMLNCGYAPAYAREVWAAMLAAAPQPEQEPVAWANKAQLQEMRDGQRGWVMACAHANAVPGVVISLDEQPEAAPLYAAPAPDAVRELCEALESLRAGCPTAEREAELRHGPNWRNHVIDAALAKHRKEGA